MFSRWMDLYEESLPVPRSARLPIQLKTPEGFDPQPPSGNAPRRGHARGGRGDLAETAGWNGSHAKIPHSPAAARDRGGRRGGGRRRARPSNTA